MQSKIDPEDAVTIPRNSKPKNSNRGINKNRISDISVALTDESPMNKKVKKRMTGMAGSSKVSRQSLESNGSPMSQARKKIHLSPVKKRTSGNRLSTRNTKESSHSVTKKERKHSNKQSKP